MKNTLRIDDSHIVGESDKGVRMALYHVWNVELTDDYNCGVYFFHEDGVYFFHEERLGGYDEPSKEEIWKAYEHEGMDSDRARRIAEEGAYFVERVSIV